MTKINDIARMSVGLPVGFIGTSGSSWSPDLPLHRVSYDEVDSLWERMYVNPKPVIIVCGFCKAHNVITSPCCIQCGAPMGAGVVRQYA